MNILSFLNRLRGKDATGVAFVYRGFSISSGHTKVFQVMRSGIGFARFVQ
jgi:hypothetical protein